VKGSYAGAMGAPQFMPSNYRRYAVDADADGHVNLWANWDDVCASVGNYLKEHGWNAGEPVLSEASVSPDKPADLDGRSLALSETVASLRAKGVRFDTSMPADAPALLIAVDAADGAHWRVGFNNFFTITRYNHSALYAMAVYELAAALKQGILSNDAARASTPGTATTGTAAASGTILALSRAMSAAPRALASLSQLCSSGAPRASQTMGCHTGTFSSAPPEKTICAWGVSRKSRFPTAAKRNAALSITARTILAASVSNEAPSNTNRALAFHRGARSPAR